MDILKIIEEFKNLDLSKYPKDDIINLFKQVGNTGHIIVRFHRGKSVMRARPNYNNERFHRKSDYSFKHQYIIQNIKEQVLLTKLCSMQLQFQKTLSKANWII